MRKVQQYLIDALFELLKNEELDDITINKLINKAGVCRASYYRNFYLLTDIIKRYVTDLFQNIIKNYPLDIDHLENQLTGFYHELYKEKEKLAILGKRNLLHLLDDGYDLLVTTHIKTKGRYRDEYQTSFFVGACAFMIKAWIKNNFRESPKEMALINLENIFGTKGGYSKR
ncbi:MAG: TetR family transcriptional regulator C-terminal domain-containing protein [Bacilli bacterium]|nr:TetR family transcriptional regulator C-terminal domain-containing protein [Bacilli bacterium]